MAYPKKIAKQTREVFYVVFQKHKLVKDLMAYPKNNITKQVTS